MTSPRPPILALDLATRTGFAYLAPGADRPESGTVLLPDHGPAARAVALETWLWPRLAPLAAGRGLLVYETPALVAHRAAPFRVGCQLEAVALRLARAWRVDHILGVSAPEAKKHATGNGNANKGQVLEAMRARWEREDLDDADESDALALLSCALKALDDGLELRPAEEDGAEGAEGDAA